MGKQELLAEILSLPIEERVQLIEAIWESISSMPDALPLTDWQKEGLDRGLEELAADPNGGLTLEEVFAHIRRSASRTSVRLRVERVEAHRARR